MMKHGEYEKVRIIYYTIVQGSDLVRFMKILRLERLEHVAEKDED